MWSTQPDFTENQLKSIKVDTWIADGDHEEAIERTDTDLMLHLVPNAREMILPGVSHFAVLQDPRLFSEAIVDM